MNKCPKCGYERQPEDTECPRCRIVYDKYEAFVARKRAEEARRQQEAKGVAEEEAERGIADESQEGVESVGRVVIQRKKSYIIAVVIALALSSLFFTYLYLNERALRRAEQLREQKLKRAEELKRQELRKAEELEKQIRRAEQLREQELKRAEELEKCKKAYVALMKINGLVHSESVYYEDYSKALRAARTELDLLLLGSSSKRAKQLDEVYSCYELARKLWRAHRMPPSEKRAADLSAVRAIHETLVVKWGVKLDYPSSLKFLWRKASELLRGYEKL